MSRISSNPINIPPEVKIEIQATGIQVKGPKGHLFQHVNTNLGLIEDNNTIRVEVKENTQETKALSGTVRSLISNMVKGVSVGFEKKLILVGVGYRAQINGSVLNLSLGYSHSINYPIPADISVELPTQTEISIKGIDKQKVGQIAADIRAFRRPEPYKGKGVRYSDEIVKLKETKKK
ncbi:MAG: 50S ribosomal protein L6 [Nitrosomonas sp.]|nr:50S ribosomal protein L6 [Nitrosomonas sp.]MCP5250637.1 50S ribosomal protein L6 [Burkholderiales bacterium]MCP5291151.1 50S ribosomal protein L6 [Burkholderiales bacterium]MDR4519756.1 50S ribosomal protein L6 [Nitrosomonas sp.]